MDLALSGTVASVGGASAGIGLGIARALAAKGCAVTAVAFLYSAQAAYFSGVVLPVDGGFLRGLW